MGSDEEYLDNLLKSLMGGEDGTASNMSAEELAEATGVDINKALDDLNLSSDFGMMEDADLAIQDHGEEEDLFLNDFILEKANAEDVLDDDLIKSGPIMIGGDEKEDDLILMDGMDGFSFDDTDLIGESMDSSAKEEEGPSADEMLALLDGMSEDEEENTFENNHTEVECQSGLSEGFGGNVVMAGSDNQDTLEETEKKDSTEETKPSEDKKNEKKKKKGFFANLFNFLAETDEPDEDELQAGIVPSDENKDVLSQLKEEDKKKKKKKVKSKKAQKESMAEDEDELDETAGNAKGRKKGKAKKEKAKAAEQLENERPEKKLSKKNVAIIAGLGLTSAAIIVVLCSTIPGFFDRREARVAYYESDYAKSYDLLYGKRLDSSDSIIFNKSRIIMELNRKLDSYHNYLGVNQEVYALDALMSGVQKYPDLLLEAEEYHIEQELSAIYETLLNILSDKYNISESVAKVIIGYDDLTYTKKLESIVHGTPFVMPGEETQTASAVADFLPEEQIFMNEHTEQEEAQAPAEELPVEGTEQENSDTEEVSSPVQEHTSEQQGERIQGIRQPINVQIKRN